MGGSQASIQLWSVSAADAPGPYFAAAGSLRDLHCETIILIRLLAN